MARIRTIGKKEAPLAKRNTLGQKIYGKFKSIGQKIVDNRWVQATAGAAVAGAGAALYKGVVQPAIHSALAPGLANAGSADYGGFPSVPIREQLSPPKSYSNPLYTGR